MTAQPIPFRNRLPAGSPAGGQFTPSSRPESDQDLIPLGEADWTPSDADFADTGAPLPRYVRGTMAYDNAPYDDVDPDVDFSEAEIDRFASEAEDRWFRSTLAGS